MVANLAKVVLMVLLVVSTTTCARTLHPITSGFHAPITDQMVRDYESGKRFKFVVWGNHPPMVNAIIGWTQQPGHTVVERARLQEIFNEQKIQLTHTPDDDADILKVGKLLGADIVVFAEASISSAVESGAYVGPYGGASRSQTVYHVSVAVRAVKAETGEVRWSGTAHYGAAINNPESGIVYLTQAAMARAICPTERDFEWVEPGGWGESGCRKDEIKELRRKTPKAQATEQPFPEPYLNTQAENALIDRVFELFNATSLTSHQAKELLRGVNLLIDLGERLGDKTTH